MVSNNDNKLTFMQYGNNIALLLTDNDDFLPTEYKMIQGQKEVSLAKCTQVIFNGKIQLFYLTDTYSPLTELLGRLNGSQFEMVICNLISSVVKINQNGFLSILKLDIDFDHIMVDEKTLECTLLYYPVKEVLYRTGFEFDDALEKQISDSVSRYSALASVKINQILKLLSDKTESLEDVHNYLRAEKAAASAVLPRDERYEQTMILKAVNAPSQFEMEINKDEFVIGKSRNGTDGMIPFNKAVSRIHCKVCRTTGGYTIVDLGSANGTFLNRQRLTPNQPYPLKRGDSLRISNSEFIVEMR